VTRVFSAILLQAILFGCGTVARADNVDDYIKAQMLRRHIPGLSLVVVKDGKVVKSQGYGFASVELNVPAKPDTVYLPDPSHTPRASIIRRILTGIAPKPIRPRLSL
jgi:Beta-lactamase